MRVLVIPDVHGRKFWKEAIEKHKDNVSRIIFLGDFFDPYEKIGIEDLLSNYREVLDLKNSHPEKVILLYGNHDLEYLISQASHSNRHDYINEGKIHNALNAGSVNTDIIHEEVINEKRYIFSHAGIKQEWLKSNKLSPNINLAEIRQLFKDRAKEFTDCISYMRGGLDLWGSPVWSDIYEKTDEDIVDGVVQVVGHTRVNKPTFMGGTICLDTQMGYIIEDDGNFYDMNGNEILNLNKKKENDDVRTSTGEL